MQKLTQFPVPELEILDEIYITIAVDLVSESTTQDKNRIQLSNRLNEAESKLESLEDQELVAKFNKQIDEVRKHLRELITHRGGLVLFITADDIYYYHLNNPTKDLLDIGLLPNFKPLIENYQFSNNYHLLVLSQEAFELFEGNHENIRRIDIDDEDAPVDLETALGTEKTGGELNHGTFGSRGSGAPQTFHGHNETSAEKDIDRENYFRIVDKYIYDNYSLPESTPLILYALSENQNVFRNLTKNQFLLDEGINESGNKMSQQEIEKKTIAKHDEIIEHEKENILTMFRETTPEYRIDNHLDDLASSAIQGRISELIINHGFKQNGSINSDGLYQEDDNNFLKQIVARTIQTGGTVYLFDSEELPEEINMSARLRY